MSKKKKQIIIPISELIEQVEDLKMGNLKAIGKSISPAERKSRSGAAKFYNSITHYLKKVKDRPNEEA